MTLAQSLSFLLGLGLLLLVAAAGLAIHGQYRRQQMAVIRRFSGAPQDARNGPLAPDHVKLRRDERRSWWGWLMPGVPAAENLAAFSAEMRRIALAVALTVTTFAALLLHKIIGINLLLGVAAGLVVSALLWFFWVRLRLGRRLEAIDEAVPEAIDMIVRALRVGQPIGTAIQTVGQELEGPIAEEFAETSRRISYGQDPVRALREMAERCRNQNLRFFAAAVAIQSNSGGNLAEVLERLGAIARGRQQLRRKVRSITAEAKWSGRFLSFFPVFAAMMLLSINPDYFDEIADKPFFTSLLGLVGSLLVANVIFMRWLVRIE